MVDEIRWTFGQMASAFCAMHDIAPSKQTALQARLKNFNKLGLPSGLEMHKGKATLYGVGEIVEMALAVEMTQLGLTPDRIAWIIPANWYQVVMAVRMAARSLSDKPLGFTEDQEDEPLAMFVYFDPSAMRGLMGPYPREDSEIPYHPDLASDTFFYGGEAVVRDNIVRWTSGSAPRLSLINVTSMLDVLASASNLDAPNDATLEERHNFFEQVAAWAEAAEDRYMSGPCLAPRYHLHRHFLLELKKDFPLSRLDELVTRYSEALGLPKDIIRKGLLEFRDGLEPDDWR